MEFVLILVAVLFLILSLRSFGDNKTRAIWFLLLSGFCLRISFSLFDLLLNTWDESFHAVVAKNFTKHWLIPTLYDTPLIRLPTGWVVGEIWLHKQPLFLWQMALSIKLFGANIFALRFPSVVISTIQIYFIYAIGKKAVNETTGYYSALIYAFAYYPLALCSGVATNDHNDVAFVFYICASIWAWFNYSEKKEWKWVLLIGLFAGMAVMVKWLGGLLIFGGWGLTILLNKENRLYLKNYLHIAASFILCCAIFLPWQFYIFKAFPMQAHDEFELVSNHFKEVVELHGGTWYYYFQTMKYLYPFYEDIGSVVILVSLVLLFRNLRSLNYKILIYSSIVFVYAFFTIAATKMVTFTFIVSPFIYLALGNIINPVMEKLNGFKYEKIKYLFVLLIFVFFFGGRQHYADHFANNRQAISMDFIKNLNQLNSKFKNREVVIFNVDYLDATQIMFFTDLRVYSVVPLPLHLEHLYTLNKTPVILNNGHLPGYILNDKRIIIVDDIRFPAH